MIQIFIVSTLCLLGASAQATRLRGYVETNNLVLLRVMKAPTDFELGNYLGVKYTLQDNNLLDLLGTYKAFGQVSGFQNGQPNAVNTLLGYLLMQGLSADLGAQCGLKPIDLPLNADFKNNLVSLCQGLTSARQSESSLMQFWLLVMGYDAPMSEYQIWRDFFLSPVWDSKSTSDWVASLSLAALLNPYFLLHQ